MKTMFKHVLLFAVLGAIAGIFMPIEYAACLFLVGLTASLNKGISGDGGPTISKVVTRTGDGGVTPIEASIGLAFGGDAGTTLSTRTNDTDGTLTVATGHDIVTGSVFDIHWVASGVKKVTYGCTAGTVSAPTGDTSIPFTGGSGDVLPVATTVVTFCLQTSIVCSIDGDNLVAIGISLDSSTNTLDLGAHITLNDVTPAEVAELDFSTNQPRLWDITGGDTNDFTGNVIVGLKVSTAVVTTTETVTLKINGIVDATP